MTVKELKEALAAYPDDMEVQILSIFAPNYMEVQKDFYSIVIGNFASSEIGIVKSPV